MYQVQKLETSIEVNLQIVISPDGKLESIIHKPFVDETIHQEKLIIDHHCPVCFEGLTLNVSVHQLEVVDEDEIPEIKDEFMEIEYAMEEIVKVHSPQEFQDDVLQWELEEEEAEEPAEKPKPLKRMKRGKPVNKKKEPKCHTCGKVFDTKAKHTQHQRNCLTEDVICYQCNDRQSFTKMSDFYDHVRITHRSKFVCNICDPPVTFNSGYQFGPHMRAHNRQSGGFKYECERCPEKFRFRPEYLAHVENYYKGKMACRLCDNKLEFIHRSAFTEHLQTAHSHATFPCPFCEEVREFETETKLNHHLAVIHWSENRFHCKRCKKRFTTSEAKYAHRKVCHMKVPDEEATCHYCDKTSKSKRKLLNHFKIVHRLPYAPFVCHYCGKEFGSHRHYDYHMERHIYGKTPYECHHCGKRFQVKHSMMFHILRYHIDKQFCDFLCDQCNERCASMEILRRHKRTHAEKNQIECEICGRKLLNQYTLLAHKKKMHTIEGRATTISCDKCNYTTTNKKYLKIHSLQHLSDADKAFHCKYCGKAFINKNIGIRHEWQHTDTRPYTCQVCGKLFRHKADLTSHTRLHTGERPYQCQVCQKRFADRGCFRSHLVKHEKELNITLDKSVKKKPIVVTLKESSVKL